MAAWVANEIRDFLAAHGIPSGTTATNMQTYIQRISSTNPEDYTLVSALEHYIPFIMDVASATYGLGLSAGDTVTWIGTNRPTWGGTASGTLSYIVGYVVATDLNTNLVPAAAYSTKNAFLQLCFNVLKLSAYWMRKYCINAGYPAGHSADAAYAIQELHQPDSIPGISDYIWN